MSSSLGRGNNRGKTNPVNIEHVAAKVLVFYSNNPRSGIIVVKDYSFWQNVDDV